MEVYHLQTSLLLQTLHVLPGLPSSLTNTLIMKPLEELHLATDMYLGIYSMSLTTENDSPASVCVCCEIIFIQLEVGCFVLYVDD